MMYAIFAVIGYSLASSMMLVVNSEVAKLIKLPAVISGSQLLSTVLICLLTKYSFPSLGIDALKLSKPYLLYGTLFGMALFVNMKALALVNLETIIIFRAGLPLGVCIMETIFLGRALPNRQSFFGLFMVLVGALLFVVNDHTYQLNGPTGFFWASAWYVVLMIEMIYGKYLVQCVQLRNKIWGTSMFTNAFALPVPVLIAAWNDEFPRILSSTENASSYARIVFTMSLFLGIFLSNMTWMCRDVTSATTFALIGVVNKLLSVGMNYGLHPELRSGFGFAMLTMCVLGSSLYRQAPMQEKKIMNTISCNPHGEDTESTVSGGSAESPTSVEDSIVPPPAAGEVWRKMEVV